MKRNGMKNTYCATLFMYDNAWVSNGVIDDFIANSPYKSKFGHEDIAAKVYLDGDEVMCSWKTSLTFPEYAYYINGMVDGITNEHTGEILELTGISKIELTPHHPDGEVQKIKRVYNA